MALIHSTSKVVFHPLRRATEPEDSGLYGVVRLDTDDNIFITREDLDILENLQQGFTVGETAHKLGIQSKDIYDIIEFFGKTNFIKSVDSIELADETEKIKPLLPGLKQGWFKWIFSEVILTAIGVYILIGIVFFYTVERIPTYTEYFWTADPFIVFTVNILIAHLASFIHEIGHFIATKAAGGEARIRLNYRYIFVVYQTDNYYLSIAPKLMRYMVYLAGIVVDIFIIATIYWMFKLSALYGINIQAWKGIMLVIVLTEIEGIVWEFNAFLETDVYNFLSDYLDQPRLYMTMRKFIAHKVQSSHSPIMYPIKPILLRVLSNRDVSQEEGDDLRVLSRNERQGIALYSLVFIGGIIVTTVIYAFFTIPRDLTLIILSFYRLLDAIKVFDLFGIFKAVTVIGLVTSVYGLLLILYIQSQRRKHKSHRS